MKSTPTSADDAKFDPPTLEEAKRFDFSAALAESAFDLFDALPDVYFYAKDRWSRFTRINRNTLSTYDLDDPSALVGRTDRDFHPRALAEAYIAEDRRVMQSGRPVLNQLWLVPHVRGAARWFISSKAPLRNSGGEVVGLAGAMFQVKPPIDRIRGLEAIRPGIELMEARLGEHVSMEEVAAHCGISVPTLNRHFREILRTTPGEYLLAARVETARRMLVTTSERLAAIATACGFTDQSHLTKRFRKIVGMTPRAYRDSFRE